MNKPLLMESNHSQKCNKRQLVHILTLFHFRYIEREMWHRKKRATRTGDIVGKFVRLSRVSIASF